MKFFRKNNSWKFFLAGAIIINAVFIVILGMHKAAYHIDECITYELANYNNNGYYYSKIEPGKSYTGDEVFYNAALTGRNKRFDYANVWRNNADDFHPPLHYALLHTICSFMPYTFSRWQGLSLNIIFAAIEMFFIFRIINLFIKDRNMAVLLAMICAFTKSFVECAMFIRMYKMMEMEVVAFTYFMMLLLKKLQDNEKIKFTDLMPVYIFTVLGTLTQYYFLIYLFLLSAYVFIVYLFKKRIKAAACFAAGMLVSGIIAYLIFPPMIFQLFKRGRGTKSLEAVSLSSLSGRFRYFWACVQDGTGGISLLILAAVTALLLILTLVKKKKVEGIRILLSVCIIAIIYVAAISKVADQFSQRYTYCICPLILSALLCMLINTLQSLNVKKYVPVITAVAMAVLCAGLSYVGGIDYMYNSAEPTIENVGKYADRECIFIYRDDVQCFAVQNFVELKDYKDVRYFDYAKFDAARDIIAQNRGIVLMIQNGVKDSSIAEKIMKADGYTKKESLNRSQNTFGVECYLLSK